MIRRTLAGGLLLLLPVHPDPAHDVGNRPEIDLLFEIEDSALRYTAYLPVSLLCQEVFHCERYDQFVWIAEGERGRFASEIVRWFAERHPVRVDRVAVQPIFSGSEIIPLPANVNLGGQQLQDDDYRQVAACEIRLWYPLPAAPRQISMVWTSYQSVPTPPGAEPGAPPPDALQPATGTVVWRDRMRILQFSPDEPEYVWHGPGSASAPEHLLAGTAAEPPRASWRLPVPSLLALLIGLVAAWRTRTRGALRSLAALGVGALAAGACWGVGRVSVPAPWPRGIARPQRAEAIEIFRTVHANIYRAFDYVDEGDVYDTLARSVDGPLLERTFDAVYQGLILHEEGGAISRVERVEPLEVAVREDWVPPPGEPAAFQVESRWRVHGIVKHWGHVHRRVNQYAARYALAPRGGQWRIVQSEFLEQLRVEGEAAGGR